MALLFDRLVMTPRAGDIQFVDTHAFGLCELGCVDVVFVAAIEDVADGLLIDAVLAGQVRE